MRQYRPGSVPAPDALGRLRQAGLVECTGSDRAAAGQAPQSRCRNRIEWAGNTIYTRVQKPGRQVSVSETEVFDIDDLWIEITCPRCSYPTEIEIIDALLKSRIFCPNCKTEIQLRDHEGEHAATRR